MVMMKWLNSLLGKKSKDIILPNAENTSEKSEVCHVDIDNHNDIKKDKVKEILGKNPLLDLKEVELRDMSKHQIDVVE